MSNIKYPVDKVTVENREEILKKLEEYFDPTDVSFRPQSPDYIKKTALALAYADTRVYYDRLNKVVGRWNWEVEILNVFPTEYQKLIRGKKAYGGNPATEDKLIPGHKVGCTVRVTIHGLGSVCDTGEKDASDENAFTSAFAQAVKRAISTFGPGKYFYEMGSMEFPYDSMKRKWEVEPTIPDKFIPPRECEGCGQSISTTTVIIKGKEETLSVSEILANSRHKYQAELCVPCQKERHISNTSQESLDKAKN
jgi:hypothetical protein